jgi:predicted porin
MKKSLVAVAGALVCLGAQAQDSVTIYGLADIGLTSVSGYAQGRVTSLSSGIMEGSRWGLRGNEDLGGGYRALFTLESRAEIDTGSIGNRPSSGNQIPDRFTTGLPAAVATVLTSSAIGPSLGVNHVPATQRLFDRQAFVGLVTPIGGFLAGRQYTPAFEAFATFDTMNSQSSLSAAQIVSIPAGLDIRTDNALQYRIVAGGISAAAMYALGEDKTATASGSSLLGINTIYKAGAYSVGFGYNAKKNSAGDASLKTTVLGASGNMGAFTLSGMYARIQEPNSGSAPALSAGLALGGVPAPVIANILDRLKQDADVMHIGLRYDLGASGTVTVAYNRLNDKRGSNADVQSYGLAYTYPLSKRTNLNFVLTQVNNSANAQVAPGGNGYLGGVTKSAGTDSNSLSFGMRHSF